MYFKFGVDSFIWAENFSEKDLWVIEKAKELGFEVIDFEMCIRDRNLIGAFSPMKKSSGDLSEMPAVLKKKSVPWPLLWEKQSPCAATQWTGSKI